MWFENLELINFISEGALYTEFPTTWKYSFRMSSLDGLRDYIHSEKFIQAPFNGMMAKINNL